MVEKKSLVFKKWIKRKCRFCTEKIKVVDYKEVDKLKPFLSERGRILPGRTTGVCRKHQRQLTIAVKQARFVALLPYIANY